MLYLNFNYPYKAMLYEENTKFVEHGKTVPDSLFRALTAEGEQLYLRDTKDFPVHIVTNSLVLG